MHTEAREDLFSRVRGFQESRLLLTAAELGLFDMLADTELTAEEVTERLGGSLRAVTILLDALTAIGYLVKANGRYRATEDAAALLTSTSPESVLPMILHHATGWRRWSRLTDIVKGVVDGPGEEAGFSPEALRAFIGGMHVLSVERAPYLVQAVQPGNARALLDVGGASGTYTMAFLRACPEMHATLFDLPAVVEMARERLSAEGLLDRVTLVAGDYNTDPFPGGHDLVLLSAIIHQNSHEENVSLYRRCFEAMTPGGRIIIRDHVLSPDRTSPRSGAVFAINMLCSTPGGNSYTFDEIRSGLESAGFEDVRLLAQNEFVNGVVEGRKP